MSQILNWCTKADSFLQYTSLVLKLADDFDPRLSGQRHLRRSRRWTLFMALGHIVVAVFVAVCLAGCSMSRVSFKADRVLASLLF